MGTPSHDGFTGKRSLSDLRAIEMGGPAAEYCGKLLAGLGAEVIKVEPPGGEATRFENPFYPTMTPPDASLPFWYRNTRKQSVILNLHSNSGRIAMDHLVRCSDIVIEAFRPGYLDDLGLGYAALARSHPTIVYVSVTPFGQSGPRSKWESSDLVTLAASGVLFLGGWPDRAPCSVDPSQASVVGGMAAAAGCLLALYHRDRSGRGQHVDISTQEALAASLEAAIQEVHMRQRTRRRSGWAYPRSQLRRIFPCRDGHVLCVVTPVRWPVVTQWLRDEGCDSLDNIDPGTIAEDPFRLKENNVPAMQAFEKAMESLLANKTKTDILHEAQRRGLWFSPIHTPHEILEHPYMKDRNFFEETNHPEVGTTIRYAGPPFRMSETPWAPSSRAPLLGEHQSTILHGLICP